MHRTHCSLSQKHVARTQSKPLQTPQWRHIRCANSGELADKYKADLTLKNMCKWGFKYFDLVYLWAHPKGYSVRLLSQQWINTNSYKWPPKSLLSKDVIIKRQVGRYFIKLLLFCTRTHRLWLKLQMPFIFFSFTCFTYSCIAPLSGKIRGTDLCENWTQVATRDASEHILIPDGNCNVSRLTTCDRIIENACKDQVESQFYSLTRFPWAYSLHYQESKPPEPIVLCEILHTIKILSHKKQYWHVEDPVIASWNVAVCHKMKTSFVLSMANCCWPPLYFYCVMSWLCIKMAFSVWSVFWIYSPIVACNQ